MAKALIDNDAKATGIKYPRVGHEAGLDRLVGILGYNDDAALYFGFAIAEVHWRLYIDDLQRFVLSNKGELDGGALMKHGVVYWDIIMKEGIWSDTCQPKWEPIPNPPSNRATTTRRPARWKRNDC